VEIDGPDQTTPAPPEIIWEREDSPVDPSGGRALSRSIGSRGRAVFIGVVVLSALAAGGFTGGSSSPSNAKRHHHAAQVARRLGPPIGAFTYRTSATSRALATVSLSGDVRVCLQGSEHLHIFDVIRDRILYVDGDLFRTSLACREPPQRVAGLRDLLGRKPGEMDEIQCAKFSPDGARISLNVWRGSEESQTMERFVGEWAALGTPVGRFLFGASGPPWRRLYELTSWSSDDRCDWVDDHHVLVFGLSPWAYDVRTGLRSLLANAGFWFGSRSPDGRRAIYAVDDDSSEKAIGISVVVDRTTGAQRRVRFDDDVFQEWQRPTSAWAPHLPRFVTTTSEVPAVRVYDSVGTLHSANYFCHCDLADGSSVAWLDDQHLWIASELGVWIWNTERNDRLQGVTLPGWQTDRENPPPEFGDDLLVFTASNREGVVAAADPTLVEPANAPLSHISPLGISFRAPPGWRVDRCSCASEPSSHRGFTFVGAPNQEGPSAGLIVFSATNESIGHLTRRLSRTYGVGRPVKHEEDVTTLDRSKVRLGDILFEKLEFTFWGGEGEKQLFVGRVADRTIIIEVEPGFEDDPYIRTILDSIRAAED